MMEILDELERLEKAATSGPWLTPEQAGDPYDARVPLDHEGCDVWPWSLQADMELAYSLRNAAPHLIAVARAASHYVTVMDNAMAAGDPDEPDPYEQLVEAVRALDAQGRGRAG